MACLGAGAGAMTGVLTCPFDVIKTRLMTQGSRGLYKGVVDCALTLVKEEGYSALFKGVQPRVIWISIGGSVFFTALERSRDIYSKMLKIKERERILMRIQKQYMSLNVIRCKRVEILLGNANTIVQSISYITSTICLGIPSNSWQYNICSGIIQILQI